MSSNAVQGKTLDDLKELLLKPEKDQIQRMEHRLDDMMVRAKEISQTLPQAISLSVLSSNQLSRALRPVIDEAIKASVKNNPKGFAEAISPALGPGIRKSISAIILGMIQSLNQVLNHSFSIQGMKWRFEAFRTGKQFAEIVLLNTLVYQVEQIFLVHRESGIVLNHVKAQGMVTQDPDLVSAMLTAIQDFIKDSFGADPNEGLETLRMGSDRSIWIETGEHALIAAVIRGTPPVDLRIKYRELVDEIHLKAGAALEKFDGDTFLFSIFQDPLSEGLQFQEKKGQKKISPLLGIMGLILLSLAGLWGYNTFKTHQAWGQYLTRLETQKGLIILSAQKRDGKYNIAGLRDPLAPDPIQLLEPSEKEWIPLVSQWKSFYSLDPEFVFKRARQIVDPPATISLELSNSVLVATGQASQEWIEAFEKISPFIPGIQGINHQGVQNIDRETLKKALENLTALRIYFENNSTQMVQGQEPVLEKILDILHGIQILQVRSNTPVQIAILGHTDSSGSAALNQRLSRNRAETILSFLVAQGINPAFLTTSGMGTQILLQEETQMDDKQFNRAITFKPFYRSPSRGE